MVPIVAILAKHQQKMAMILRQPAQGVSEDSIMRLAAEVRELRAMVAQQTLALDNIAENNRRLSTVAPPAPEERRLTV
jgi:hypothetical protein